MCKYNCKKPLSPDIAKYKVFNQALRQVTFHGGISDGISGCWVSAGDVALLEKLIDVALSEPQLVSMAFDPGSDPLDLRPGKLLRNDPGASEGKRYKALVEAIGDLEEGIKRLEHFWASQAIHMGELAKTPFPPRVTSLPLKAELIDLVPELWEGNNGSI